jgi:hypothetical protein
VRVHLVAEAELGTARARDDHRGGGRTPPRRAGRGRRGTVGPGATRSRAGSSAHR